MATPGQVILFRHGIAEEAAARGGDDRQRRLSAKGRRRTEQAAKGLAVWLSQPVIVLHSPLVRARETASLVAAACRAETREIDALAPGTDAMDLQAALATGADGAVPVAVGHEPDLSRFIAAALGTQRADAFSVKKASACCLGFSNGGQGEAILHWLLPPRALRALAPD